MSFQIGRIFKSEDGEFIYSCIFCCSEFKNGYELEEHSSGHDAQPVELDAEPQILPHSALKRFRCGVCSADFRSKYHLARHMNIHVENRPTNHCDICGKAVFDIGAHMTTHTNIKQHQCKECPAAFKKTVSLQDHMRRHSDGSKKLICSFCDIVVFSSIEFTRHIAKCGVAHPSEIEFSNRIEAASNRSRFCILCGTKVKNMQVHLRCHARERSFQCALCEKSFTQSGHRNSHIRRVHNIEPNALGEQHFLESEKYSCTNCNRHFDTLSDLDIHMRSHMEDSGLCKVCNKVVAFGCAKMHLRTHTNAHKSKYRCAMCPTSFRRKDHLERHLADHTGEMTYGCSCCSKRFVSNADLSKHMRSCHPEYKNASPEKEASVCSVCGLSVKNIEQHMRVHSEIRPYTCSLCPAAFTQKNNLDNHFRRHTGEKPYNCAPCSKSFHSLCALNSHKRRHKKIADS